MLVQRWGILCLAMPCNIWAKRVIGTIKALAKLHNYCINELSEQILPLMDSDDNNTVNSRDGFVEMMRVDGMQIPVPLD